MSAVMTKAAVRAALGAGAIALAAFTQACADKELLLPNGGNTKFQIQLSIVADQQSAFGPRYLFVAAGFDGANSNDDGGILGYRVVPYQQGTRTVTVDVDIAPCLAYYARLRKQTCPLLYGAAIVEDTTAALQRDGEPFAEVFDLFFDGPFYIGAGGALPSIRAIELSASRFAVVKWEGDAALQVGGPDTPNNINGAIAGVAAAGSAPATLFAVTLGQDYSRVQDNQPPPGPYPAFAVQQNGVWKRFLATSAPTGAPGFTDITALSATEAYAAHSSGLYTFNGTSVSKVGTVTDVPISVGSTVTSAGAKLVIVGGQNGAVWISNGQTWQRINSATEAFAASLAGGSTFKFDGTNWTSVPVPNNTAGKMNLQCTGPGQAFVAAQNGQRYSWNGNTWVALPTTGLGGARAYTLAVVSPTEMYMAGDSANVDRAFFRLNGTSWQEIGRKRFASGLATKPWADPRSGAYFASQQYGRVDRVTGSTVSVVSYNPTLRDISMSSLNHAVVAGNNTLLARWNGTRWNVDAPPPGIATNRNLRGVWTDGPSNAWAAGQGGALFRFDGTAWTQTSDNLNAVWGVGADVWVAGETLMLHCKSTGGCATEPTGGSGALYSVWGSSATNVFAVGADGRIVQYRNGTWSNMASPTKRTLYRVTGTGPSDVWAVGDSVLIRFNGTEWRSVPDPHGELADALRNRGPIGVQGAPDNMALWMQSPTVAFFSNLSANIYRAADGRSNGMIKNGYAHSVMGISGLSSGCALAVTETFSDAPTQSLYRGIGPTGCLLAPMQPPTSWP
jgi:hypothetical protein